MFYVSLYFQKNSHLKTNLTCFNNINKTDSKKLKKYFHDRHKLLYWKNVSSFYSFINYLYCWTYNNYILHKKLKKTLQEPDWFFLSFWNLKSLNFTCSHWFSLILLLDIIFCCSFLFVVTRYHSLSLVVTCSHLLSLFVPIIDTRCHSLSLVIHCHSLFSLDIPPVCLFTNDPDSNSFSILIFWYIC